MSILDLGITQGVEDEMLMFSHIKGFLELPTPPTLLICSSDWSDIKYYQFLNAQMKTFDDNISVDSTENWEQPTQINISEMIKIYLLTSICFWLNVVKTTVFH